MITTTPNIFLFIVKRKILNTFLLYQSNYLYERQIEIQYSLDLLPNLRPEILQHQQLQCIIHKSVLKEQIKSGRIIYNVTTISQIIVWKSRKNRLLSENSAENTFSVNNLVQNTFHINHTNANEPTCLFVIKWIFLVQRFFKRNGI